MAHPGWSASSTIITLVLLIFGNVEKSGGDLVMRKPIKQIRSSHSLVVDQRQRYEYERSSSKVGNTSELQRFFEVSMPITVGEKPVETIQLLSYDFAFTYGHPPANASYVPTQTVLDSTKWNKVVLKWSAVCQGLQFDRIAGVWLGGVEIFRTCTAEPTSQGIIWEVEKDVTRYASLWRKPQEVVALLNNVVDSTYTGIINVTLSVDFYHEGNGSHVEKPAEFQEDDHDDDLHQSEEAEYGSQNSTLVAYSDKPADVIFPIREVTELGGWGYWFLLSNETKKSNTSLQIPPNTYKAILEVCVSSHGDDEFWYAIPDAVNGTFREVVVLIDGREVGAVYPFIVVYTGGFYPLFWQPAAAIGAFDLPSYDLDITPLLGNLLDDKNHTFSLTVTDALDYWLLQANLHIWIDPKGERTSGRVVDFLVPSSNITLESSGETVTTTASRSFSYVGYMASSFGNLTTSSSYTLNFSNILSTEATLYQMTETESTVVLKNEEEELALNRVISSYPFDFDFSGIRHSLKQDIQSVTKNSSSFSSLSNNQNATETGETQQTFSYKSSNGCYQRAIIVEYNVVVSDNSTSKCS